MSEQCATLEQPQQGQIKHRSAARRIAFIAIGALMLFAFLELSLRLLAIGLAISNNQTNRGTLTIFENHPYLTSVMKPNKTFIIPDYPGGGELVFTTNSHGFRGPEFQVEKETSVYRIVVIGGSAVATGRLNETQFTALLERELNQHYGGSPEIEVINAGVPGFTSTQEMFLLHTQVLTWNPDLVIIYDGGNDMVFGSMPDYVPNQVPRNAQTMAVLAEYENPLSRNLMTYQLLSRALSDSDAMSRPEKEVYNPRGAQFAYAYHREAVDVYQQNLDIMASTLSSHDIDALLVYQPYILTTGKSLTEYEEALLEQLQPAYVNALERMLPEGATAMRNVAESRNVPWADFSSLFDEETETMFNDEVHQSDAGNQVIACAIAAILLEKLEWEE
jgi:lysophospholipase L1-like esterase